MRGGPPSLEGFGLSDADLSAIADVAEVDENALAALFPMKRRDIVDTLARC